MTTARTRILRCAFGWVALAASDQGILGVALPACSRKSARGRLRLPDHLRGRGPGNSPVPADELLARAAVLLQAYFAGRPTNIDLPLDLGRHTEFQRAVWQAAAEIPYGETRSYAWIAERIGRPRAARAVGRALGANPIAVLIP